MNTKVATTEGQGALDPLKWILSLLLVVGGIYGFYHFTEYQLIVRVLVLLPIVLVALWLAVLTQGGSAFWNLVKQARLEIYKVVWPTRPETVQTTAIVVAVVFVMAIILWLLDMFFGWLASLIIG